MGRFFAISDIHITNSKDPAYSKLIDLIHKTVPGDVFYLGGDIFDFLVGDQPALRHEYSQFFSLIVDKKKSGVRFLYVEGNHDFHLDFLADEIEVSSESFSLDFGGKRFYLAHGDLVDQEDKKYLILRSIFRSAFIRFTARALPDRAVLWVGDKASEASRNRNPRLLDERGPESLERIRKKFRRFSEDKIKEGFHFVVLGHCHDLDEKEFNSSSGQGHYMNIGYPKKHGRYVYWEPGLTRLERREF